MPDHPKSPHWPLEMSGEELRRVVAAVSEHLARYLDSLPHQLTLEESGAAEVARSLMEPLPCGPRLVEDIFGRLFEQLAPLGFNAAAPGYMAFIPGGGLPLSAVADLIADIINRYVTVWRAAPAFAQIDATVVRWFCDMVGYPPESGGVLTTGGSLSNAFALYTARRNRNDDQFARATIYTSNQAHHSVTKAVSLVGVPLANVRSIDVDPTYRVRLDKLQDQIARDRSDGYLPLAIVGHAGTTNTGAIDDLNRLADMAERESVWFHVDAAYGGFFMLTERGKQRLRGIERADSICLDPHKGLFLPYGTGCLLARDRQRLSAANDIHADYLPPAPPTEEFVDSYRLSPELSRDFRGLRIWLPFQLYGVESFRQLLNEKLDLAEWVSQQLHELSAEWGGQLEIFAEPQLTALAFRLRPAGWDERQLNALNTSLRDTINAGRRIFLSSTILHGKVAVRICILSFRTHHEHAATCLDEIRRAVHELGCFAM